MPLARTVEIANRHPRLRFARRDVVRLIQTLDEHFPGARNFPGCPPGELSLVFLTDPALARLHGEFMDDPASTDVITFAGDSRHGTAGEICVSADTAAAYARKHRRDFSTELTLYVVHGWLHLAGYDDLQPVKKRAMRRAEARALRLVSFHGCTPGFNLSELRVS